MKKNTHLIERCSSFLRTGVAWRLKEHGYTFSEAYWRLRDGKGLVSAYDKESLKLWGSLITCVRRYTGPLRKLLPADQQELTNKREEILEKMEAYRDRLEAGSQPKYLYDNSCPVVMEYVLYRMTGDVRELDAAQQQELWERLDIENLKKDAQLCMKEIKEYTKLYDEAEAKDGLPTPEEWTKRRFERTFVKDKVWQIRTGHDSRSSVGAGIGQRLNFIWDIPTLTVHAHRATYQKNRTVLESYREWKEEHQSTGVDYVEIVAKVHSALDSLVVPNLF